MIFLGSDVADDSKVSEAILMLLDLFLVWISTAFFSQTLCCLLFNGCNRLLFPIFGETLASEDLGHRILHLFGRLALQPLYTYEYTEVQHQPLRIQKRNNSYFMCLPGQK